MPVEPLLPEQLYRCCADELPKFATTAELEDLIEVPGQERAMRAIRFGIGIKRPGYNIFALGGPGTAKHAMVREFLDRVALGEPVPRDLCYVFNFEDPHKPMAIELPPGSAAGFRAEMAQLVKDLRATMPAMFESANYRSRRQIIDDEFKQRQEAAFEHLQELGKARSVMLIRTPAGFGFAPAKNGSVVSPEEFQKLPEDAQAKVRDTIEGLQEELERTLGQLPLWERERREQLVALNRKMTTFAVGNRIDEIQARYKDNPAVLAYLDAVERDIVDHVEIFLGIVQEEGAQPQPGASAGARLGDGDRFRRYQVNVIVDQTGKTGAPVVYEDNPTFANLVGVIEQLAEMGALISDFTLIKGGALHRANGGYLIVDARKLLIQPHAYEALKRAIRSREIHIESPGQMYTLVTTVTLDPQPVPLNIRVVLVGDRQLYYQLSEHDPDFGELFKVAADFEDDMPRQPETMVAFARLVATIARREYMRPFERDAVERIIEHASRLADDARKLSMRISAVADVMREADYIAEQGKRDTVGLQQVEEALTAQRDRSERVRDRSHEMIQRGLVLIATDGAKVGQVNGLSVMTSGHHDLWQADADQRAGAPGPGRGHRYRAAGGIGRPDPFQGRVDPRGLSGRPLCRGSAAVAVGDAGVRAVLWRRRRRQRLVDRALCAAVGAVRSAGQAGLRRYRIGESVRRDPGDRRRQREDRGLLRCLRQARIERAAGRADPRRQCAASDAAARRGRCRPHRQVPYLSGVADRRGDRAAHRRDGGRAAARRQVSQGNGQQAGRGSSARPGGAAAALRPERRARRVARQARQ